MTIPYSRFTEVGGPSFYISFLRQDSLSGPLKINVSVDSSLDWAVATPELAYWDIGEERALFPDPIASFSVGNIIGILLYAWLSGDVTSVTTGKL